MTLIPAPLRLWHHARVAACDGAWMGPSAVSRGSDRRLEGESGWLEIQEARCDRCRRGAQQWSLCAATALRAQGANVDVGATGRGGKPKHRSGTQIAVTRVPQGGPRDPSRVSGSPTGFPGRLNRSLPGRVVPVPGLPMRHPRSRRTPGPHGRGRTARAAEGRFQRSRHDQAMLRTDASGGAEIPTMRRMLSCRRSGATSRYPGLQVSRAHPRPWVPDTRCARSGMTGGASGGRSISAARRPLASRRGGCCSSCSSGGRRRGRRNAGRCRRGCGPCRRRS